MGKRIKGPRAELCSGRGSARAQQCASRKTRALARSVTDLRMEQGESQRQCCVIDPHCQRRSRCTSAAVPSDYAGGGDQYSRRRLAGGAGRVRPVARSKMQALLHVQNTRATHVLRSA